MERLYLKYEDELLRNKKYLILSSFISIYIFLPEFIIADMYLIVIFMSFLPFFFLSKISKFLFIFVSFFTLLYNSIVLHIILHWGNTAISSRIQAGILSPKYESLEYINTYIEFRDIITLSYFLIGIFLFYRLLLLAQNSYKIIKITALFLLLLLIWLLSSLGIMKILLPYKYIDDIQVANQWKDIADMRKEYLEKKSHITKKGNLLYDKIIIIIGESANKHHMGIYNYKIDTTPFLSKLLKKSNSYKFDNIIASSNQTRYAVPLALTDAKVENFYNFASSESLINYFKSYGYKTYWLSNQFTLGKHDSYISSIAKESDYSAFANFVYEDGGKATTKYDIELLNQLNQDKIEDSSKELYIFHLLGSHFQYKKRYPKSHSLFQNPKNIVEEYDNTIYYTDYVISEIYKKFNNTNFLFIYLSDHGEVVNLKGSGHGFFPTYKDEYDTPLVVYSSLDNKRIDKLKERNISHTFNMESFNNIVKYIIGKSNNFEDISNNSHILVIDPKNIKDYNSLNTFEYQLSNKQNKLK